jgi:Dit-like phage tail protein
VSEYVATRDAPVVSWDDDGTPVFILFDCIPSISDERAGQVTEYAIEDGTSIGDSFVRKPQVVRLEVNQTQTPMALSLPQQYEVEVERKVLKLEPLPNDFHATGLLFAIEALKSGVAAVGGAIAGALGAAPKARVVKVNVITMKAERDRINALYDELVKAYDRAAQFKIEWLGRTWENMVIERLVYTRSGPRELGVFALDFKRIAIVTTKEALAVQAPAELTMKIPKFLGNQQGETFSDAKKRVQAASLVESSPLSSGLEAGGL